jgi:hypothetical protein
MDEQNICSVMKASETTGWGELSASLWGFVVGGTAADKGQAELGIKGGE